jgi:hypothetical protein
MAYGETTQHYAHGGAEWRDLGVLMGEELRHSYARVGSAEGFERYPRSRDDTAARNARAPMCGPEGGDTSYGDKLELCLGPKQEGAGYEGRAPSRPMPSFSKNYIQKL